MNAWADENYLRELAGTVREQRLILALDVQAFADGLFMPELIVDDFRQSFSSALRLREVAESSAALLETMAVVVQSYLEEAQWATATAVEARQRRWQLVVGVASGVAIPAALLLSYFGVSSQINAPPDRSVFDMSQYFMPWSFAAMVTLVILWLSVRQHSYQPSSSNVNRTKNGHQKTERIP
jgi:hypothetical protein